MEYLRAFMRDMAAAFRKITRALAEFVRTVVKLVKANTRLDATLTVYEDWGGVLWSSPESFNDTVTSMTRRAT